MGGAALVEVFVTALLTRLRTTFPNYTVEGYEPGDSDLAPRQIWVTDDSIGVPPDGYADGGMSTHIVLPVYVTSILDVPWDSASMTLARQHRLAVIAACQGVVREFSDRLLVMMRGEEVIPRQSHIAAYVQLDVELLDLEAN